MKSTVAQIFFTLAMVTVESTKIRVLVDSVQDRDEAHNEQDGREEHTPLLRITRRSVELKVKTGCVKSKAALLVLCWNTLITIVVGYVLEYGSVLATAADFEPLYVDKFQTYAPIIFGFFAFLYLFYHVAGCLADIKCGRYKTITNSLWFTIWSGVFTSSGTIIIACYYYKIILLQKVNVIVLFAVGFGSSTLIGIILLFSSYISFNANVIQFGIDQLCDLPSEDSVLFVHWFVFTSHLGAAINKSAIISVVYTWLYIKINRKYIPEFIAGFHTTPILALIFLAASVLIAKCKYQQFTIDSGSRNPYKLVYRVIKFAAQHKIPIRRSAFTYCEDELPSRMDLGKEKYGGPFTTEQVEDVKAFLGILVVLLRLGPMFITDIASSDLLYRFSNHLHNNWYTQQTSGVSRLLRIVINGFKIGVLTEILIVMLILFYLYVLRPFICRYIPGMLKRIGLGIITRLLSILYVFLIDTFGHTEQSNDDCFLNIPLHSELGISTHYLIFAYFLNALCIMFFYTATFEFICAQSPHAMKGLFIGTFFLIKGLFQLLGITIVSSPFASWDFNTPFPSCGFVYYLVNILVALIGLVAYTWVARSYQYRQRDEPDSIYRYAEEYYDRPQNEPESIYDHV